MGRMAALAVACFSNWPLAVVRLWCAGREKETAGGCSCPMRTNGAFFAELRVGYGKKESGLSRSGAVLVNEAEAGPRCCAFALK